MKIVSSELNDIEAWIALAREVEHLFGPMAEQASFLDALRRSILNRTAFCIRSGPEGAKKELKGGIVISKEKNEITWFAVSGKSRGIGCGRELLRYALGMLDRQNDIFVQTFDESFSEGQAARNLYISFGFKDHKPGGLNPAGINTMIMKKAVQKR